MAKLNFFLTININKTYHTVIVRSNNNNNINVRNFSAAANCPILAVRQASWLLACSVDAEARGRVAAAVTCTSDAYEMVSRNAVRLRHALRRAPPSKIDIYT